MSTLKVHTIQDASGSNSSTAEQIAQGRAKVWINFDMNAGSITDSFNVSSILMTELDFLRLLILLHFLIQIIVFYLDRLQKLQMIVIIGIFLEL